MDWRSTQHCAGDPIALAPFHRRAALAAAQVLDRFDEEQFSEALAEPVGISFGQDAVESSEGRALIDLLGRLLSRLYPTIEIRAANGLEQHAESLRDLALGINPAIDFGAARVGVVVGARGSAFETSVYAGSEAWDGLVSDEAAQPLGLSDNVLGAGAAACIAAGNLFRLVALPAERARVDHDLRYSTFHLDTTSRQAERPPPLPAVKLEKTAIVGLGAIGNGLVWALGRSEISGRIDLVDPETIELSNLQRYVLAGFDDVGE